MRLEGASKIGGGTVGESGVLKSAIEAGAGLSVAPVVNEGVGENRGFGEKEDTPAEDDDGKPHELERGSDREPEELGSCRLEGDDGRGVDEDAEVEKGENPLLGTSFGAR